MSPLVFFCFLSGVINFITTLSLGIFLLLKSSQIKTNRYFAYFCFSVAFWSFFYFLWLWTPGSVMAEYYLRTCMIGVFFIPATFLHFVVNFLNRKMSLWFIAFNYALGIISIFFVYTFFYAYGMDKFIGFWWLQPGPFFHVIILHFALVMSYAFWLLYYYAFHITQEESFKRQIKLVFMAVFIGYISGSMNYLMWYRVPVPPVANALVAAYVLIITYAILKYQLLDIKIVIKNSLVYSILASIITIVYFGMIYFSEHFLKMAIGYHSTVASLATAMVVAVFFIPLKDFIQSLIEKYIFKATDI